MRLAREVVSLRWSHRISLALSGSPLTKLMLTYDPMNGPLGILVKSHRLSLLVKLVNLA